MPPAFLGEESQALGDGPDPRANLHKDGRPDKSVVHRHGQASGEAGANRDVDFGHAGHERVHESDGKMEDEGRGGSVGNADKDVVARLRLAKALSFSSGAGMVAWNKFSSLWLLSVGLTPTEVGVLKSAGLVAKSVCQPMWALLADLKVPARIHPSLSPVSLHFVAIFSGVLSLIFMEILHQSAAKLPFAGILVLRTFWCIVNAGSQLIDALVAHMSHKTKEGFGKQRLWGSLAWGSMSLLAGALIDKFGLDVLFAYTLVARSIMMFCVAVGMYKIMQGGAGSVFAPFTGSAGDKVSDQQLVKRLVPLLKERPQVAVLLLVVFLHGFVMVICESILSMQMDREFAMSRTLNGLSSTVGILASVPTYYFSKSILESYGHFAMIGMAQGLTAVMFLLHYTVTKETALLVLPIQAIKGGIVALFWSSSVDLMQNMMDTSLQSTGQTALQWMYYTIGGGIGHIVWSSYYQNRGAPETYLLGFAVALANMWLLRVSLEWSGLNQKARGVDGMGVEMSVV